jgi:hypothetical protein
MWWVRCVKEAWWQQCGGGDNTLTGNVMGRATGLDMICKTCTAPRVNFIEFNFIRIVSRCHCLLCVHPTTLQQTQASATTQLLAAPPPLRTPCRAPGWRAVNSSLEPPPSTRHRARLSRHAPPPPVGEHLSSSCCMSTCPDCRVSQHTRSKQTVSCMAWGRGGHERGWQAHQARSFSVQQPSAADAGPRLATQLAFERSSGV